VDEAKTVFVKGNGKHGGDLDRVYLQQDGFLFAPLDLFTSVLLPACHLPALRAPKPRKILSDVADNTLKSAAQKSMVLALQIDSVDAWAPGRP
jgi:hypothetical protein